MSNQFEHLLELAAGGRPSTWSPPGRLVEHDSTNDDLPNNTNLWHWPDESVQWGAKHSHLK